jgi:hypothetical protein
MISYNSESEQAHTQFSYNSHKEASSHKLNIYNIYSKFTCSHKLNIYNIYSKSYTKTHSKLAIKREEVFGALALLLLRAGLLLPLVLHLLPFSIDITTQCGVVRLRLLKFFLGNRQFVF